MNVSPTDAVSLGEEVTYTCDSGSFVAGGHVNFTLLCDTDGYFSPHEPPICVKPLCGPSPSFPLATPVATLESADLLSTLLYHCVAGTELNSENELDQFEIRCVSSADGFSAEWTVPTVPSCHPEKCPSMPPFPNTKITEGDANSFFFGDIAELECSPGFGLNGDSSRKGFQAGCDAAGIWMTSTVDECDPVICGMTSDIDSYYTMFGKMVPFPDQAITRGSQLSIVCDEGAEDAVSGSNRFTFICEDDSSFTATGVCSVPCPLISSVAGNATSDLPSLKWWGDETTQVTCNDGYHMINDAGEKVTSQITSCSRDGTYSDIRSCELVDCGEPPLKYLGGDRVNTAQNSLKNGDSVEYSCPYGYYDPSTGSKSFTAFCDSYGELSGEKGAPISCERVQCSQNPSLAHAVSVTNVYQYFHFEDKFVFECLPEFGDTKFVSAFCTWEGIWQFDGACAPRVVQISQSIDNTITVTKRSSAAGYAVSFVFILIPFFLLV